MEAFGFGNFSEAMEDFNSYYRTHWSEDRSAAFKDPLQPSHLIEDLHETSRDVREADPVSAVVDEVAFPSTNMAMMKPTPATLDDGGDLLDEIKDSDKTNVLEQADQIGQMNIGSKAQTTSKPFQSFLNESLPDLLRSGSPLQRRVSSPVSDTVRY